MLEKLLLIIYDRFLFDFSLFTTDYTVTMVTILIQEHRTKAILKCLIASSYISLKSQTKNAL